jgi:hypothetical protein
MDRYRLATKAVASDGSNSRTGDAPGDLSCVPALGFTERTFSNDPTLIPLVIALVLVASPLAGFFVGYVLGPLAFMVMR